MILTVTFLAGLAYARPVLFLLVFIVGCLVRELLKYHFRHWQRENVPGPKPSLLTGNMGPTISMKKHFAEVCSEWYRKYSGEPFIGYYKVFKPAILLRDPELVRNILVKDYASFSANDFTFDERVEPLLVHNPFVVDGERWKSSRQLLTPIFTARKMKQLFPMMDTIGKRFVEFVDRKVGKDVEAKSISAVFTTQNVAACAFSLDAECFENPRSEWREMGKKVFQPNFLAGIKILLKHFAPILTRFIPVPFIPREVDTWIRNLVRKLLKERQNKGIEYEDQLQSLLNMNTKIELTEEIIAGHALAFFAEGFETSSSTLGFLIYNLAANPEIQERLYEEIQHVLEQSNNEVSYDVMQKMDYLDWALQESLRLSPVIPMMQRLCTKKYPLRRHINGKPVETWIKEGTTITVPVLSLHMDPKYYPEPEKFLPERFSPEEKLTRTEMVYLPFGEGPRMCMGMRFGQTQVKAALLRLMQKFKFHVSPNHKPFVMESRAFLYQAKDGLLVRFERR